MILFCISKLVFCQSVHIGSEDCCARCFYFVSLALGEANKKTNLVLDILAFGVL